MLVLENSTYFGSLVRARQIGSFRVSESRYRPFEKLPQHAHAQHVLIVTLAGSHVDEMARLHDVSCPTGSVQFHPANMPHAHRFGPSDSLVLNITLSDHAIEPYAEFIDCAPQPNGQPLHARWLATRMLAESITADQHSDLVLHELIAEFFAQTRTLPLAAESSRPRWLDGVMHRVRNEAATISLSSLADEFQRHPAHLARSFRKWQGCSIGEYRRRRQLELTVKELAVTSRPISEIALSYGFTDQPHFTRVLRAALGLTPGQIRRRARG